MNLNHSRFSTLWLFALAAAASFPAGAQQTNPSPSREYSNFRYIYDWNIFDPRRIGPIPPRVRQPTVDRFWLSGTMSYSKGLFAVFDGTQQNFHEVVEAGGKIAGFTVAQIGDDFVKLTSGTNTVQLKMDMQMSHSEDGKWTPVQGYGGSSYVSSYSSESSGGFDRYSERGSRRRRAGEYNSDRGAFDTGGMNETFSAPVESSAPGGGGADSDVAARMKRARAAAMGGGGAPDNGGPPGGNPNGPPDNGPAQQDGTGPQMDTQGPVTQPDGGTPPTTPPDGTNPTPPPTGPGGTPNGNP